MRIPNFDELQDAVKQSTCFSQVTARLRFPVNSLNIARVKTLIVTSQIDTSHFTRKRKYARISKECPVCLSMFEISVGGKDGKKITCSHKCANTFFRSGENHPLHIQKQKRLTSGESVLTYVEICWKFHKRVCVICGEDKIVAVHHFNGDHSDNDPKNLVPLCPTHHAYCHSRHFHLVESAIRDYIAKFEHS